MEFRRKQWDALIQVIIEKGLEKDKLPNNWNLRDTIAHIAWYDKVLLDGLATKAMTSEFWQMSIDDRNEMILQKSQDKSLNDILAESKQIFDDLMKKVEELSDEELNSEDHIQLIKGKRITWDIIGAQNFWHFEDHEEALIEHFDLDYGSG